jgi:catechol 2,3-dioxygenase-like lactoylglutathione lyase family enzyme
MVMNLDQVTLPATDVERSAAFYRKKWVFELLTRLDAASGRVADQHFVIDEVSAHIKRSRTDSEPRDDE